MRKQIKRKVVLDFFAEMIKWRDKGHAAYCEANAIAAKYQEACKNGESISGGKPVSSSDADRLAAQDPDWQVAVGANVMYDRFATRDAAVLQATLKMAELGEIDIVDSIGERPRYARTQSQLVDLSVGLDDLRGLTRRTNELLNNLYQAAQHTSKGA